MTKADLIYFLQPFSNDIEIRLLAPGSNPEVSINFKVKSAKYFINAKGDEYAILLAMSKQEEN